MPPNLPLKVSNCAELSKAMVIFELWGSSGNAVTENHSSTIRQLLYKVHALRSFGK